MKSRFLISLLITVFTSNVNSAAGQERREAPPTDTFFTGVGHPALPFTMTTPEGEVFTSEKLKGKVIVLDFWATWCAPCKKLTHEIDSVISVYHKKNDFLMIGVSYRETNKAAAVAYWKKQGYKFPMAVVEDVYGKSIKAGNPTIIVIDKKGIVRGRWDKYTPETAGKVKSTIDECL